MKRMIEAREDPIEQLFGELWSCLVAIYDIPLPSLETRLGDIRTVCKKALDILGRLEPQIIFQKAKR